MQLFDIIYYHFIILIIIIFVAIIIVVADSFILVNICMLVYSQLRKKMNKNINLLYKKVIININCRCN